MATPPHMWVVDDQGNELKSSSEVHGREGSAELYAVEHGVTIPTDRHSGQTVGTRTHGTMTVTKAFCPISPQLAKACCDGKTLNNVTIRWYKTDDSGQEKEYFTHTLDGVKVVGYRTRVTNTKNHDLEHVPHLEEVDLRYKKITWSFVDGNIQASDEWTERGGSAS